MAKFDIYFVDFLIDYGSIAPVTRYKVSADWR